MKMLTESGELEDDDAVDPVELSRYWQQQIQLAEQDTRDFRDDGKKVVERFKSEKSSTAKRSNVGKKFNILYSNTEVLRAALFGKMAKPNVRRRFQDRNPVARQGAEIIERSLIYCQDTYASERIIELAVQDYLLPGRGVVRVEYEPVIAERPVPPQIDPVTMQPMMGGEGEMEEYIAEQNLRESYVYWEDFLCEPARNWAQVNWIAFRHTMDGHDLDDQIFENAPEASDIWGEAKDVPRNWMPDIGRKDIPYELKKAEVWEIWDKRKKSRIWIVKGHEKALRRDDDPYGLQEFWPCAEPLNSYSTTETFTPEPEFHAYRDQADDLDEITARISRLTRALKRRGVYDKAMVELRRLASAGDNEFIPVENYASLMQKGGLEKAFQTEDITVTATVLKHLYEQRNLLVQSIYEVTGISDIVRGSSDPNETLGAQQLKAQFGSGRLKRRQGDIQRWIRDLYRIKAEIIAEHYEPEIIQQMTGVQVTPEIMQLLRDEKTRGYQIDVETDSTTFEDQEAEKKARVEFLTAVAGFLAQTVPLAQQMPMLGPLLVDMLSFGTRGFKAGRELEDKIEQAGQQITQMMAQPKPPPPPDPAIEKVKAEIERDNRRTQADLQLKEKDLALKDKDLMLKDMDVQARQMESMRPQPVDQPDPFEQEEKQLRVEHSRVDLEGKRRTLDNEGRKSEADATDSEEKAKHSTAINAVSEKLVQSVDGLITGIQRINESQTRQDEVLATLAKAITAPKRAVRGPDGRVSGIETVM
jgi:hypothetical protein